MTERQPPVRGDVIQHEVLFLDQPQATPGRRTELHWRAYANGEWDVWLQLQTERPDTGTMYPDSTVALVIDADGNLSITSVDHPDSAARVLHTIPAAECLQPAVPRIEHRRWPPFDEEVGT